MEDDQARKDFFISYTGADRSWAEWMAWQLEQANYSVMLQAWDFRPGGNFVLEMDQASKMCDRTIAVLSANYFKSKYTPSEWAAAFRQDPLSRRLLLLPVRVRDCNIEGLPGSDRLHRPGRQGRASSAVDPVGWREPRAGQADNTTGLSHGLF